MLSRQESYAILGIPIGSDITMIKKAYKQEALKTHPDKVQYILIININYLI
jgi:DnaJ-class molecular chaperone